MRKGLYTTALLFSLLSVSSAVQADGQMASNRFVLSDLACLFWGLCDEGKKAVTEQEGAGRGKVPPKDFAITTQKGGGAFSITPGSKYERGGATRGKTPPKV